jgi:predicted AlkP superfamily pyrophosphatase or phosphodiesterase
VLEMRRLSALIALMFVSAGCGHRRAPADRPRIVALVVIDQMGAWTWPARSRAANDGVARAIREGRVWTARYPYAAASTAPGHAALGTGAPPAATGIIGNEFWDRDAHAVVEATRDPAGGKAPSSARLRVDGLADALLGAHPDAHAVAVALKDRSALLTLGHSGTAVWFDADRMRMVSNQPADWIDELPPLSTRAVWSPIDPSRLRELSGEPDDAPGELSVPGWTASFPHALAGAKMPHKAFESTPFANQAVADAAIAAIEGEHLGDDDVPDLLVVSFSANDYIGHAFGPDSWEAWDAWLRLDVQIGDLERALDDAAGPGGWAMIITADHGAPSTPEHRHARGEGGARISYEDVAEAAERGADRYKGGGPWIAVARYPTIWLSAAGRALDDAERARVELAASSEVAALAGIARVAPATAFEGDCTKMEDAVDRAVCLSLDPERSGEIVYLPAEGTIFDKRASPDATGHGSPYGYDRDVPLVIVAPGIAAGQAGGAPVSALAIAPTIAKLLDVPPPPAAHEPPLL